MKKVANVISKIALALLILSVLGLLVAKFLMVTATDEWDYYYAAVANMILGYTSIAFAVIYVACDFRKLWAALKELLRKTVVALKRNPSVIPLIMMFVSFLLFSLNLTDISNATAKVQGKGMGLCQFSIMLFSLLCMVTMLNAFPRRKKANIPMVVLMFVMFGILIYADVHYRGVIYAAWTRPENPIVIDETTRYIADAYNMLGTHMVMVIVTAALVVLLPVYSKLIRKIKTSIEVEGNENMVAIEIGED